VITTTLIDCLLYLKSDAEYILEIIAIVVEHLLHAPNQAFHSDAQTDNRSSTHSAQVTNTIRFCYTGLSFQYYCQIGQVPSK